MAAQQGRKAHSLERRLFDACYHFEFHQAVKILEFLYPQQKPLGEGDDPAHDVVSLSSRIDYTYSPSDLYALEKSIRPGPPARLEVNFWGLAGAVGPLPTSLTDQLFDRLRQSDTGGRDFLDIFNHRLLSILHRIRKKYWIGLGRHAPEETVIGGCLRALGGLGLPDTQNRLSVPDRGLLAYGGSFWTNNRSKQGLEDLLSDFFDLPVLVSDLIGGWRPLEHNQQTHLGFKTGANQVLGRSATLGTRIWDQMRFMGVHLGPLSWTSFIDFLPMGSSFQAFQDLTFFYLGRHDVMVHYILRGSEIKTATLGSSARLGWTSFLHTHKAPTDDSQVRFKMLFPGDRSTPLTAS